MKKNPLADLSLEELLRQKKMCNGVVFGIGIVMLLASAVLAYTAIKSKNYLLIAVVPCSMLSLLPSIIRLGQLNAEIKSRNNDY